MNCLCDHAGYCPLLRTTVYPEQWDRCRSDSYWLQQEMKHRGIRWSNNGVSPKPSTCAPCEAGLATVAAAVPAPKPRFQLTKAAVCNRHGKPAMGLRDSFPDGRVFLLGGGQSLKSVDLTRLQRAGIATAAMNNVATIFRPVMWFSVDYPRNFSETIWRDPGVTKFTLDEYILRGDKNSQCQVQAWNEVAKEWANTGLHVYECPNVFGFAHHHDYSAETFLDDPMPYWGANHANQDPEGKSHRVSVMLPTLWMLYWLGFRTVYLLGCDFKVGEGQYAFDEKCKVENDSLFGWLDRRFNELHPHFRARGFTVLNCTEGSALSAFERISLDSALEACLYDWPDTIVTRGQYRGN